MERSAEAVLACGVPDRAGRAYIARLVLLFCAGWAVIYADRRVLYPLLTVIARQFGLSGVQTGLITAAYSITIHTVPNDLRGIASGVINGGMSLGPADSGRNGATR